MVVICQAATARHFATISLLAGSWKRSKFSGLLHSGIFRPFFDCKAHDDGRDLPGCCTTADYDHFDARAVRRCARSCCTVADYDHFDEPDSTEGDRLPSDIALSPIENRVSVNINPYVSWMVRFWLDMG